MKSLIIFFLLAASAILLPFALGKYSQRGAAPGVVNGVLAKCSAKPNCVCSEYPNDTDHYIEPVKPSSGELADISKVVATIQTMGGVVVDETEDYVAATFRSRYFGFIDDVEIRIDQANGVYHVRSASRVGYSDAGVNRKRADLFKKLFAQQNEEN